jgi:chemotaxis protein CheD
MKRTSAAAASPGADSSEDRRKVFLSSGRIVATTEPTDVTTVLGSCVATCLWDPEIRAGAACRFVLPYGAPESSLALRLANVAIHEVIRKLVQLGGDVSRMQAKIFGGANIMPGLRSEREPLGTRNVIAADEHLASVGIPVVARDVGGKRARKLIFKTDDGTAWVKTI